MNAVPCPHAPECTQQHEAVISGWTWEITHLNRSVKWTLYQGGVFRLSVRWPNRIVLKGRKSPYLFIKFVNTVISKVWAFTALHGPTSAMSVHLRNSASIQPGNHGTSVVRGSFSLSYIVVLSCSETYSKQGIMFVNRPYWPYCRNCFWELALQFSKRTTIKACTSVRILYFARFIRLQRSSSLSSTVKSVECIHVSGEHSKQLSREPWIVRAPVWSLCSYKPTGARPTGSL